jgi:hypothetical protein
MCASKSDGSVDADARRVLTKAVLRSADRLGMNRAELARVLGTSTTTIRRMTSDQYRLTRRGKEWELATLFVRLYGGLATILADDKEALRSWMRNPNLDLRMPPVKRIMTATGLVDTVNYIDAKRARS